MYDQYKKRPISISGNDIPIFSITSDYTDNYEKISKDHLEKELVEGINPFIQEELRIEMEGSTKSLISKYSKPGIRILDVGVGLGRLLETFNSLDRYGMDISLSYLEITKKKGIDVCYSLIEDMPYIDEYFDLVVCTDVLEHVFDLNQCCTNILKTLKPDGTLIIRVPYREDLSGYLSPGFPYKYVHLRAFDEYSLKLFFEKVLGCQVIEYNFTGTIMAKGRMKLNLPRGGYVLTSILKKTGSMSDTFKKKLTQKLFYPVEINVVIKK